MNPWEEDNDFIQRWLENKLSDEELKSFKSSRKYRSYKDASEELRVIEGEELSSAELAEKVKWQLQNNKESRGRFLSLTKFVIFALIAAGVALAIVLIYYGISDDTVKKQ